MATVRDGGDALHRKQLGSFGRAEANRRGRARLAAAQTGRVRTTLPHGGRVDAGDRRFGEPILTAPGSWLCCLNVWDCAHFLRRVGKLPFWTQRAVAFSARVLPHASHNAQIRSVVSN